MKTKYSNPDELVLRNFSTMMSFDELQNNMELILLRDSPLNSLIMEGVKVPHLNENTGAISLAGLNLLGEIEIKYRPLKGNNLLSIEYFRCDESSADLIIKFLAESVTEVFGLEIKYSMVNFLQDLKGMDISKHILFTDAAISSARYCEFDDYKEITKSIPVFFNSDTLRKRDFKLISHENPDWKRNRVVLYNDTKTELAYQHIIYSKKEKMYFRLLYAVDNLFSKFIIGRVDKYYPMPF